jgi:hypothetical protein
LQAKAEIDSIRYALTQTNNNKSRAAKFLGIHRTHLYKKNEEIQHCPVTAATPLTGDCVGKRNLLEVSCKRASKPSWKCSKTERKSRQDAAPTFHNQMWEWLPATKIGVTFFSGVA